MIVLLGWQFALAEFIGAPLMVVILTFLYRRFLSEQLVESASEQADKGVPGSMEGHAEMDMSVTGGSIWSRITSPKGLTAISHYFVMDWGRGLARHRWRLTDCRRARHLGAEGVLAAILLWRAATTGGFNPMRRRVVITVGRGMRTELRARKRERLHTRWLAAPWANGRRSQSASAQRLLLAEGTATRSGDAAIRSRNYRWRRVDNRHRGPHAWGLARLVEGSMRVFRRQSASAATS